MATMASTKRPIDEGDNDKNGLDDSLRSTRRRVIDSPKAEGEERLKAQDVTTDAADDSSSSNPTPSSTTTKKSPLKVSSLIATMLPKTSPSNSKSTTPNGSSSKSEKEASPKDKSSSSSSDTKKPSLIASMAPPPSSSSSKKPPDGNKGNYNHNSNSRGQVPLSDRRGMSMPPRGRMNDPYPHYNGPNNNNMNNMGNDRRGEWMNGRPTARGEYMDRNTHGDIDNFNNNNPRERNDRSLDRPPHPSNTVMVPKFDPTESEAKALSNLSKVVTKIIGNGITNNRSGSNGWFDNYKRKDQKKDNNHRGKETVNEIDFNGSFLPEATPENEYDFYDEADLKSQDFNYKIPMFPEDFMNDRYGHKEWPLSWWGIVDPPKHVLDKQRDAKKGIFACDNDKHGQGAKNDGPPRGSAEKPAARGGGGEGPWNKGNDPAYRDEPPFRQSHYPPYGQDNMHGRGGHGPDRPPGMGGNGWGSGPPRSDWREHDQMRDNYYGGGGGRGHDWDGGPGPGRGGRGYDWDGPNHGGRGGRGGRGGGGRGPWGGPRDGRGPPSRGGRGPPPNSRYPPHGW